MLRIYITDLAAYNQGHLVGKWITLPLPEEDLEALQHEVLNLGASLCHDNEHEELFITDYEWEGFPLESVEEYSSITELNEHLDSLKDTNREERKAIAFLLAEGLAIDLEDAQHKSEDVIIHHEQNMEELAYDLIQECYNPDALPDIISNNINYDGIAQDLEMDGCYFEVDGDIYEYIG
jgi:hypothetical protein